ncbi:ABC transporter substrate-binding protein [Marivita hallyeonensis]|uniref:Amino acid/amide ABC transporter substrate-binding protein, HAAT family n=1 Tax=Marivita hallyeonensis TaxID=996342 RepID=A0A1M5S9Z5_9RHOB|nr:ABC transporter substrate-binding protein [Marivita hallyeonensis]SHH35301.1 amino acid/amide ABC transporter substrate-binding protein, HAAT family [Marivita hallyeonensis]
MKLSTLVTASVLALAAAPVVAADKTINIAGFGASSGVVGIFGQNSGAAMAAAVEKINAEGGVTLADGSKAMLATEFYDDRCNAEEGISVLRRIASTDALVAVGPTCSNVAEPLFGILQAKVDDAGDTGLQFPVFTDVAIKGGLAGISEWVFRNTPSEATMYDNLFAWIRETHPDAKTIYGGVEEDFAHSRFTWYSVMKTAAEAHGFEVVGEAQWLLNDTNFSNQARGMRRAEPDVVAISAHPFTTCGMLREMDRQRIEPKVLVGLTSSSSLETLTGCANEAEGIIIPTSFAPVNDEAKAAAAAVEAKGGQLDLHSASAWENIMILKDVIEAAGIEGTAESLEEDRRKIRDGLATLTEAPGLLGANKRMPDGEAVKPYVFVNAESGNWEVLHNPGS